MRALCVFIAIFAFLITACGGTPAAVTPSQPQPTQVVQPATPSTTVGGNEATPTPTSMSKPTTAQATATPQSSLIIETDGTDSDVDKKFIDMSAQEVDKVIAEATKSGKDGFKVALPFDPHGVKFNLRAPTVSSPSGETYTVLVAWLQSGTATVKLASPYMHLVKAEAIGGETHRVLAPMDESKATVRPDGRYYDVKNVGGNGVFTEVPEGAEVLIDLTQPFSMTINGKPAGFVSGTGKAVFRVSASTPPMTSWKFGSPLHILIRGMGVSGPNGAMITRDSLLRAPDGRIVYVK